MTVTLRPVSRFYWLYGIMLLFAAWLARATHCPSLFTPPPTDARLIWPLVAAVAFAAFIVGGGRLLEQVPWYRDMAELFKRVLAAPELLGPDGDPSRLFLRPLLGGLDGLRELPAPGDRLGRLRRHRRQGAAARRRVDHDAAVR